MLYNVQIKTTLTGMVQVTNCSNFLKHLSVFTTQDDSTSCGVPKQSEFLTVPGSAHSSHHQQREMRRSSSEQAPCTLPTELTEMRSKSFDYGNLPSSRQGEVYSSASAMKERRRGYLVRQVRKYLPSNCYGSLTFYQYRIVLTIYLNISLCTLLSLH